MAWINSGNTSLITHVFVVSLTQETHFEEGSSERINHQLVVDWKSTRHGSDDHQYIKRMMTHVRRIARCMLCVDREPAAKDVKMMNIRIK